MFWAIASGISVGASRFDVTLVGGGFIAFTILTLTFLRSTRTTYVLSIMADRDEFKSIVKILSNYSYDIKSKTITGQQVELTVQFKNNTKKLESLESELEVAEITKYSLVGYNKDV